MLKIGRTLTAIGLLVFAATSAGAQEQPQPQPQTPPQQFATPPVQETTPATPPPTMQTPRPAREPKFFVHANAGYQMNSQDVASSSEFEVYDEPASLVATQSLKNAPIFDATLGYHVSPTIAFAAGVSIYSDEGAVAVTASVPHPLFFDQFRTVNVTAEGSKHTSIATNLMLVYVIPFVRNIDISVMVGPSIIAVKQDLISGIAIEPETGPSYSSPTVTDITVVERRKTAFGFNAGADASYMLGGRYGVGATVRYLWGSADLEGTTDSLTLGGFQVLGGLRVRF